MPNGCALGRLDRLDEVARRGLAEPLQRRELLGREVVDVRLVADQPLLQEARGELLPEPLDVHHCREVLDVLEDLPRAAAPVRADGEHGVLRASRSACRSAGTSRAASACAGACPCGAGSAARSPAGSRRPRGSPPPRRPRARPCAPGPPRCGGSRWRPSRRPRGPARARRTGTGAPVRPTFQKMWLSFVVAVIGGNFQATAQRGSRPTTPSSRHSVRWSTLITTPSISKSSASRRSSHHWQRATTSSAVSWIGGVAR